MRRGAIVAGLAAATIVAGCLGALLVVFTLYFTPPHVHTRPGGSSVTSHDCPQIYTMAPLKSGSCPAITVVILETEKTDRKAVLQWAHEFDSVVFLSIASGQERRIPIATPIEGERTAVFAVQLYLDAQQITGGEEHEQKERRGSDLTQAATVLTSVVDSLSAHNLSTDWLVVAADNAYINYALLADRLARKRHAAGLALVPQQLDSDRSESAPQQRDSESGSDASVAAASTTESDRQGSHNGELANECGSVERHSRGDVVRRKCRQVGGGGVHAVLSAGALGAVRQLVSPLQGREPVSSAEQFVRDGRQLFGVSNELATWLCVLTSSPSMTADLFTVSPLRGLIPSSYVSFVGEGDDAVAVTAPGVRLVIGCSWGSYAELNWLTGVYSRRLRLCPDRGKCELNSPVVLSEWVDYYPTTVVEFLSGYFFNTDSVIEYGGSPLVFEWAANVREYTAVVGDQMLRCLLTNEVLSSGLRGSISIVAEDFSPVFRLPVASRPSYVEVECLRTLSRLDGFRCADRVVVTDVDRIHCPVVLEPYLARNAAVILLLDANAVADPASLELLLEHFDEEAGMDFEYDGIGGGSGTGVVRVLRRTHASALSCFYCCETKCQSLPGVEEPLLPRIARHDYGGFARPYNVPS